MTDSGTPSSAPSSPPSRPAPAGRGGVGDAPPDLVLERVGKRFGRTVALADVDAALPGGELICFLGPSGCGKTTLLRIVAGLETASEGRVRLGERDLTDVPAHRREIGMVFQSFALFPHLDVAENVAYGLRIRGAGRAERRRRADELLELVQLGGYGRRRPSQLSGGQRQRVAMARALALEPELFLLDEPLSALDAKLRGAMQVELKQLQQRLGITTVIVTHDQEEAMTMADVVVVMGNNRVQQIGPPLEVYRRPANRFVADFIGSNNFLEGRARGGGVEVAGVRVPLEPPAGTRDGDPVAVSIRPEDVTMTLEEPAERGDAPRFEGRVTFVRDLGRTVESFVTLDAGPEVVVAGSTHLETGTRVWLAFPAGDCVVFEADDEPDEGAS